MLRTARNQYLHEIQSEIRAEPKKFWNFTRCQNKKSNQPQVVRYKDASYTGDTFIACAFAEYFSSVYSTSSCNVRNNDNFLDYGTNCITVQNISSEQVAEAIKRLKPRAAPGEDNIPAYLVKRLSEFLVEPLTTVFNISLETGVFPNRFKNAWIKPIHKSGDTTEVENYRPVAILNVFSKVFEIILHSLILKRFKNGPV